MHKSRILATSSHPGGINAIIPVIKRLRAHDITNVVVVGHEASESILEAQGIEYESLTQDRKDTDLINALSDIIQRENPLIILTGQGCQDEEHPIALEQAANILGRANGVKTISVSDYWTGRVPCFSNINSTDKRLCYLPSKITVIDELQKQIMIGEGFPPEILVITGNPHFDDLERKAAVFSEEQRREIRERIGVSQDATVGFYAANVFQNEARQFGYWDIDNLRAINNAQLPIGTVVVAKFHPRIPEEDKASITDYLGSAPRNYIQIVDEAPHNLVLATDVTLTPFSKVGIEAIYMGKPVVAMQPHRTTEDPLIPSRHGIIPYATTEQECTELVEKVLRNQGYRQEIVERAAGFRTDGRATLRVTELIYKELEL